MAIAVALLLGALSACGGDDPAPPTTLSISVEGATSVVQQAARLIEGCYRDGTQPEICTSGTSRAVAPLCVDLAARTDLATNDVAGGVTVYAADNPRYGEVTCLFSSPRTSLALELWRDPPDSLCSSGGGVAGSCAALDGGLEVGRQDVLPSMSVAGSAGRVVATTNSPELDAAQLAAIATGLTRVVFGATVTAAELGRVQAPSTKPE